jgi:HEAT repeat protein
MLDDICNFAPTRLSLSRMSSALAFQAEGSEKMRSETRYTPLFLAVLFSSFILAAATQDKNADRTIESLIKKLYSTGETERQLAKEQLTEMGLPSVKPLLDLLHELVAHPGPRFPTGKEREGADAIERYQGLSQTERLRASPREFFSLEISSRLENDICEVLGRLKATESIPTLVEIMVLRKESHSGDEFLNREMVVLVQIGGPVVAPLIEAIQKAEATVASSLEKTELGEALSTEEAKRSMIQRDAQLIKLRAATVLGQIGDVRALPVLESLLEQDLSQYEGRGWFQMRVRDSIQKILTRKN